MIFSISKDSIEKIINKKGNNRHSLASEMKILPNTYRKKKRNSSNIAKVKSLMLKENLPTQRYIVNTLKCPVSSVNKIINSDLKLKKAKKYNVQHLSEHHTYEHRTRCRTLYKKTFIRRKMDKCRNSR